MGGYTETPNFIYDLMPEMKEAEIKVVMVVVRKTIGWHTERVSLRKVDFENLTGLSGPSVVNGIKAALERGIIEREPDGDSYSYWITEPCNEVDAVKNFNQEIPNEESNIDDLGKKSLPSAVKNFNQDELKIFTTNKRNINTNKPKKKEGRAHAPSPRVVSSGIKGAKKLNINSPYLQNSKFVNGYIPPGTGQNAVEVYYERFKINLDDHRLTDPLEDDLIRFCPNLDLLREVVTEYERRGYKTNRNISLILDWYREPHRFRNGHNGNLNGNHKGSGTENYQRPATSQHSMADHRAVDAKRRAEGIPF